jgi:hypothetical protein
MGILQNEAIGKIAQFFANPLLDQVQAGTLPSLRKAAIMAGFLTATQTIQYADINDLVAKLCRKLSDDDLQRLIAQLRALMTDVADASPRSLPSDEYYTHPTIIEAVRRTLDAIDLDPASCLEANTVVQATQFYDSQIDGLRQPWYGRVWLNPPFSQWIPWVPKIVQECRRGHINALCALSSVRTCTARFMSPLKDMCVAICILRGRLPFWGGGTDGKHGPDYGHLIYYLGPDVDTFAREFGHLGNILANARISPTYQGEAEAGVAVI